MIKITQKAPNDTDTTEVLGCISYFVQSSVGSSPLVSRLPTRNLTPVLRIELRMICASREVIPARIHDAALHVLVLTCATRTAVYRVICTRYQTSIMPRAQPLSIYSRPCFTSHQAMMHHSTSRWKKMPPEMPPAETPRVPGHTACLGKQPGKRAYLAGHTRTNVSAGIRASDESQTPLRALAAYMACPLRTRLASKKPQHCLDHDANGPLGRAVAGWHVPLGLKARQLQIVAAGCSEAFPTASDLRLYHKNHCLRHRC